MGRLLFEFIINAASLYKCGFLSKKTKILFLVEYFKLFLLSWCPQRLINGKKIKLAGFLIEVHDIHTLLYLYGEIFIKNIYYFHPDKKNPVIYDCGSNIGMSIIYFLCIYPNSVIHAYEPDPQIYKLLKKNCDANNLSNVYLHQKALSNKEAVISFYTHEINSLVNSQFDIRGGRKIQVQCVKLSSEIGQSEVDLLKIDVEGAELAIFEDIEASGCFSRIQNLIVEYHLHLTTQHSFFSRFLQILESENYTYQIDTRCIPLSQKVSCQDVMIQAVKK